MDTIKEAIVHIQQRIYTACTKAGRDPAEIRLLLATKTVEPQRILQAFACGCTLIGENKVQELSAKAPELAQVPHTAHFIGHLQSNKIAEVLHYADCIQSVDRIRLAEKIERKLIEQNKHKDILIQVNTSLESSKSGCLPDETAQLVTAVAKLPHLHIKGLMTIGALTADSEKTRSCFRCLKELQKKIAAYCIDGVSLDILSMGMSGDLETAIEEGSTMIRVGSAIFGMRT